MALHEFRLSEDDFRAHEWAQVCGNTQLCCRRCGLLAENHRGMLYEVYPAHIAPDCANRKPELDVPETPRNGADDETSTTIPALRSEC